jgi:hypothetical protein
MLVENTTPTNVGRVLYAGAPLLIVWFTTAIAGESPHMIRPIATTVIAPGINVFLLIYFEFLI